MVDTVNARPERLCWGAVPVRRWGTSRVRGPVARGTGTAPQLPARPVPSFMRTVIDASAGYHHSYSRTSERVGQFRGRFFVRDQNVGLIELSDLRKGIALELG